MSGERVLSRRELNRALLARQLLLARAEAPLPEALERVGGLQAQYAPSMYIGLWSRLANFRRNDLTEALERREVVQATLMRVTIHLVSRRDFWPLALATRDARRQWWLRTRRGDPGEAEMVDAARVLAPRLAAGPVPRKEMDELLGKPRATGVGLWTDLVRVPPSGTWERRRADLYGGAEEWLGPPGRGAAEEGVELLVRRYLGGFGPASPKDIADWAGLGVRALAPALERLGLRRFRDPSGKQLLDLPDAPLPDPETPAPVRFLPTWDATLLAHARRSGILPEEHRPKIFTPGKPQSVPAFLVDGVVAGTWRHDGSRIELEPFARMDGATRRALDAEAERLNEFHQN